MNRVTTALTIVLILGVAVAATLGYYEGVSRSSTISLVSTEKQTSTFSIFTTATATIANDSLSNIAVANISLGCHPLLTALDPATNVFYAYCANSLFPLIRNFSIVAVDANTNKVLHTIANVSGGSNPILLVNPVTNMLYIGKEIINGTTDQITEHLSGNMSFVALDTKDNLLYAEDVSAPTGATVYQINGSNYNIVRSQNFESYQFGGFTLDTNSNTLFALSSSECQGCTGSSIEGVMAIDAQTLTMESNLSLNSTNLNFVSIAFNPRSNAIYVTGLPNLLIELNATSDMLLAMVPITTYENSLSDVIVNPSANEILLSGLPLCSGLSECLTSNLFVLSSLNYGELARFTYYGTNDPGVSMQFDPTNGDTYMAFYAGGYVLPVRVPNYQLNPSTP